LSRTDSADILRTAFRFVAQGHNARRRVLWFWTPTAADSTAVSTSPDIRAILIASGLTASENRPVGDDTVVFHVRSWKVDPESVLLELRSAWTEVRKGNRPCRAGSGNVERVRLRRTNGEWIASHDGPVIHGDNVCAPFERP
jgi:hypothetical protein